MTGALGQTRSPVLANAADREAFRRWFTFLAEAQYFTPLTRRPPEIVDCSALVRYAYREALRGHSSAWAAETALPMVPAFPSVTQYNYPRTPTGARIFRTGEEQFAEFADAETLYRFNTFFVTSDIRQAQPGDLLFFRRPSLHMPFHSMIVVGRSYFTREPSKYVIYDTGAEGNERGEIKRLSIDELLIFPDPHWHPVSGNPQFLGVFRWRILQAGAGR